MQFTVGKREEFQIFIRKQKLNEFFSSQRQKQKGEKKQISEQQFDHVLKKLFRQLCLLQDLDLIVEIMIKIIDRFEERIDQPILQETFQYCYLHLEMVLQFGLYQEINPFVITMLNQFIFFNPINEEIRKAFERDQILELIQPYFFLHQNNQTSNQLFCMIGQLGLISSIYRNFLSQNLIKIFQPFYQRQCQEEILLINALKCFQVCLLPLIKQTNDNQFFMIQVMMGLVNFDEKIINQWCKTMIILDQQQILMDRDTFVLNIMNSYFYQTTLNLLSQKQELCKFGKVGELIAIVTLFSNDLNENQLNIVYSMLEKFQLNTLESNDLKCQILNCLIEWANPQNIIQLVQHQLFNYIMESCLKVNKNVIIGIANLLVHIIKQNNCGVNQHLLHQGLIQYLVQIWEIGQEIKELTIMAIINLSEFTIELEEFQQQLTNSGLMKLIQGSNISDKLQDLFIQTVL